MITGTLNTVPRIRERLSAVYRPAERLGVGEWACRHRVVPARVSARPGPWREAAAPVLRGIQASMSDPLASRVTVMKSSQSGFTEALINALLRDVDQEPRPWMFLYPNGELAASTCTDRVLPSVRSSPAVAGRLGKGGERADKLTFDRMTAYFVGSNSATNLKSRPIAVVAMDELDEFEHGAAELAEKRTDTFPNRRIFAGSTPTREGEGVHQRYLDGDRRRLLVPCPRCGEYQELVWAGLRWEGGIKASAEQVRRTIHYQCRHPQCRGRIDEHERAAMISAGVWAPEGVSVHRDGTLVGEPLRDWGGMPGQHHSYRYNALYVLFTQWADLACEWVEQRGDPTPVWVNHRLGEPYRQRGHRVELDHVRRHCLAVEDGGYRIGTVPREVLTLTGAVDVQRDRIYLEVLGWGERAAGCWLVHYDVLPASVQTPGALDAALAKIAALRFPLGATHPLHAAWRGAMPVAKVAVDSGDGLRTAEVYRACRALGGRFIAAKGSSTPLAGALYRKSVVDHWPDGSPIPGGLELLLVDGGKAKGEMVRQLLAPPPKPGPPAARGELEAVAEWRLPAYWRDDETGEIEDHDEYLAQLTAEELVREVVVRGRQRGRVIEYWRIRPGRSDNHFGDCRCYNLALAEWLGLRSMTLEFLVGRGKRK